MKCSPSWTQDYIGKGYYRQENGKIRKTVRALSSFDSELPMISVLSESAVALKEISKASLSGSFARLRYASPHMIKVKVDRLMRIG